jgi:hypothetical protein
MYRYHNSITVFRVNMWTSDQVGVQHDHRGFFTLCVHQDFQYSFIALVLDNFQGPFVLF